MSKAAEQLDELIAVSSSNPDSFYVVADTREKKVITLWPSDGIPLHVVQMNVGDFAIVKDGKLIVSIERKTWADLAGTITDASRRTNHLKMLQAKESTGCLVFYLIEGRCKSHYGPIRARTLRSFLMHRQFEGINVIYSLNETDTCETIAELCQSLTTYASKISGGGNLTQALMSKEKLGGTQVENPQEAGMLGAIRNITEQAGAELANRGYRLADLYYSLKVGNGEEYSKLTKEAWADMRMIVSKHNAARSCIMSLSSESKASVVIQQKVLSKINGVSANTAKAIIAKHTLSEIILGKVSAEDLQKIVPAKKPIKSSVAKRIISLLTPSTSQ